MPVSCSRCGGLSVRPAAWGRQPTRGGRARRHAVDWSLLTVDATSARACELLRRVPTTVWLHHLPKLRC